MEAPQIVTPPQIYPVGTQDFAKLRRDQCVYVDKTALIYQMTRSSNYVFLSRPRRFGKSLLCSTMKYYFEGRRDLFSGLAIERLEQEWTEYPVIHISLNEVQGTNLDAFSTKLCEQLEPYEQIYGGGTKKTPGSRFKEVVLNAYQKTGKGVVVIIDEYDAPLLHVLDKPELLEAVREKMIEFYMPLKNLDPYLRFCFITGITKFSQLSIFSTINNLEVISLSDAYAAICGITESEIHQYFQPGVEALGKKHGLDVEACYARLKEKYDGYHFSIASEDIYNPFSLLSALKRQVFDSFWFTTGTPTYLFSVLKQFNTDLSQLDEVKALAMEFDVPTEAMSSALPLLYQSGYLTIKDYDPEMEAYVLGLPNREVRVGLAGGLLPVLSEVNLSTMAGIQLHFCNALRKEDLEAGLKSMRSYFAALPYPDGGKELLQQEEYAEWHYSRIFYMLFSFLNNNLRTEVKSAQGRADMVVYTVHTIYVFEFKVNRSADEALKQIDKKGYMVPYEADGRKLVKCGVSFSSKTRTLEKWKIVHCKA
jgi:hypothetical protein